MFNFLEFLRNCWQLAGSWMMGWQLSAQWSGVFSLPQAKDTASLG
jgi:hypothetical protein